MYKKTTSIQCAVYAEISRGFPETGLSAYRTERHSVKTKRINHLWRCDEPVYLQAESGILGILFTSDPQKTPELYVMHKTVKVKPGTCFALLSISDTGRIITKSLSSAPLEKITIPTFTMEPVRNHFEIDEIFAFYYSTKGRNYVFEGESHTFWELTFVDTGELHCCVDGTSHTLGSGSLMFFAPNSFHTQSTDDHQSCAFMTVMFNAKGLNPDRLCNRTIRCTKSMHVMLTAFMHHSEESLDYRDDLLTSLLKMLIVYSINDDHDVVTSDAVINPSQDHYESELLNEIILFIRNNIHQPITIQTLCKTFAVSRSSVQVLFKKHLHTSPKYFINTAKLEHSKVLLKQSTYTVSQVSDILGYASIHYFSRKFKQVYGITPSEFARSITN